MNPLVAALILTLLAAACSRDATTASPRECTTTCDNLAKEFRDQCEEADGKECLANVDLHHQECLRLCEPHSAP